MRVLIGTPDYVRLGKAEDAPDSIDLDVLKEDGEKPSRRWFFKSVDDLVRYPVRY